MTLGLIKVGLEKSLEHDFPLVSNGFVGLIHLRTNKLADIVLEIS